MRAATPGILQAGLWILLLLASPLLRAQQTADEERDLARNPLADAIKLPIGESIAFEAGSYNRIANSLQLLPIIPVHISDNWLLLPRIVTTPLAYQPDATRSSGGSIGLGDTIATVFLTPARPGKLVWGVAPSLLIPTSTNSNLGFGKWGLGPSVGALVQPAWGSFWIAVQNLWSLPGNSQRSPVNLMIIETSFSYNLPHDWYLTTNPTINADWTQTGGDRWLVPCGGGVGRTFNMGRQAVDLNLALYYNPVRPARELSPKWQMSLQFTLLYPRKHKEITELMMVGSSK